MPRNGDEARQSTSRDGFIGNAGDDEMSLDTVLLEVLRSRLLRGQAEDVWGRASSIGHCVESIQFNAPVLSACSFTVVKRHQGCACCVPLLPVV